MIHIKAIPLSIIIILSAAFVSYSPYASEGDNAGTITVDQGGQFHSIQAAINGAAAGDTILVYSGTYNERVNVNKRVTLKGVNSGSGLPVVDAGGSGNPFTISADGVWLEGFGIRHSQPDSSAGVFIYSHGNTITGNIIRDNSYGVRIEDADGNAIRSNAIDDNINHGIFLHNTDDTYIDSNDLTSNDFAIEIQDSSGFIVSDNVLDNNWEFGIYMYEVKDGVVKNNRINTTYDKCDGIGVRYGTNLTISNNYVGKHYYGIKVYYSSDCLVENNTAVDTGANIRLDFETHHVTVRNNTVGNGIDSILVNNTAHDNTIEYNTVYNSREGIYVLRSCNNILLGNNLFENAYGIRVEGSTGNIIKANNFKDNTYNIKVDNPDNLIIDNNNDWCHGDIDVSIDMNDGYDYDLYYDLFYYFINAINQYAFPRLIPLLSD